MTPPARSLAIALSLWAFLGCDSPPATPDAPLDAGVDAPPVTDSGGPDAGSACVGGSVCDLAPNEGCTGGEFCGYLYAGGARTNECVASGAGALGVSCTANADCSAPLSCVGGFCVELCCPTGAPTCGTGTACGAFDINVGAGVTDPIGLCACTVGGAACPAGHYCDPLGTSTQGICLAQGTCNRLTQDCPTGGCYGTVRECAPAGTAMENEACMVHTDCVPGFWCRRADPESLCTAYCEVGGTTCPAGTTCTSFGDDEPTVGGCYP